MTRTSARLERRVRRDFGAAADDVVRLLQDSPHAERVQAAIVIGAGGDAERVREALRLADLDWRDVLMNTQATAVDLATSGWEVRLDAALGEGAPVQLWRPIGPEELGLIQESGWREWPPRPADQPTFTAVLGRDDAHALAQQGSGPDPGTGWVTQCEVEAGFMSRYAVTQVGGRRIRGYRIPAVDLADLNANLVGRIQRVETVRG